MDKMASRWKEHHNNALGLRLVGKGPGPWDEDRRGRSFRISVRFIHAPFHPVS